MSEDNDYHLTEDWIDHLRFILSATNTKLTFNQIPLAVFQGHNNAVRKIFVFDNESFFITSSADKSLKLWPIQTKNKVSNCQHTYSSHAKSIKDFVFMPSSNLVASTDSTIHVLI